MPRTATLGALAAVVGFLAFVEFTSGVLQGYYTPMLSDIARNLQIHDADVNWFEGTQLMLSALVVPAFAKLGDMVGHKRMLLISTALTAAAALALPFTDSFWVFLIAWTLMGFYVVWLPLEIALIWSRSRRMEGRSVITARAAGLLVAALEGGAILGALLGGALIDVLPLTIVLLIPALLVVVCFFVILFGVKESPEQNGGVLDTVGLVLISMALICFTGGLSLLRLDGGLVNPWSWAVVVLGLLLIVPFVLWELRHDDPQEEEDERADKPDHDEPAYRGVSAYSGYGHEGLFLVHLHEQRPAEGLEAHRRARDLDSPVVVIEPGHIFPPLKAGPDGPGIYPLPYHGLFNKDRRGEHEPVPVDKVYLSRLVLAHYPPCPHLDYIEKILSRKGVKVKKGSYKSKTAQKRRDEGIYDAFEWE